MRRAIDNSTVRCAIFVGQPTIPLSSIHIVTVKREAHKRYTILRSMGQHGSAKGLLGCSSPFGGPRIIGQTLMSEQSTHIYHVIRCDGFYPRCIAHPTFLPLSMYVLITIFI